MHRLPINRGYMLLPVTNTQILDAALLFKKNDDGKPYQCKHAFNCPYQLEAFEKVLQKMAEKPEEYIGEKGKRMTNTAEGFHGNALAYRDKRILFYLFILLASPT